MLEIVRDGDRLILTYESDFADESWVDRKLERDGEVTVSRVFHLDRASLLPEGECETIGGGRHCFVLGTKENDYFRIGCATLGLDNDVFIHEEFAVDRKTFIAPRGISVFKRIDRLVEEPIFVGGPMERAIPDYEFRRLIENFPTSTELDKYASARVSRILKDYFETMSDAQKEFEEYRNKRRTLEPRPRTRQLIEYEIRKFEFVRNELSLMLQDQRLDAFKEKEWQRQILEFILLLFPKYVAVLPNLRIRDFTSRNKATNRFIDLTLVDSNGTLDIIEIKQPFEDCLLYKGRYRSNYIPKRELTGSIMQVEKYIFHLKKWGLAGEKETTRIRTTELPPGLEISVTNPRGLVIIGRSTGLSPRQLRDLEVIKRKYNNILDIITYDDLLSRLDNVIMRLSRQMSHMPETDEASPNGTEEGGS